MSESRTPTCDDCGFELARGELDRSGQSWWCPVCAKAGIRLEENKRLRAELAAAQERLAEYRNRAVENMENARDFGKRLLEAQEQIAALEQRKPVIYRQCAKHYRSLWRMKAPFSMPTIQICPNCEADAAIAAQSRKEEGK